MVIHSSEIRHRDDGAVLLIERFGFLDNPIWFQEVRGRERDISALSELGFAEGCPGLTCWCVLHTAPDLQPIKGEDIDYPGELITDGGSK